MLKESKMPGITSLPQKVLLISSAPATGEMWAFGLRKENIMVTLELDPANSLKRWNMEISDLIVIDLNLSSKRVIELIKGLRNETIIPILILSRNMTDDDFLDAYLAGADECIQKPFSPSIFIAKIKVWLRRSWSVPIETLGPLRVGKMLLHPGERTLMIENNEPIKLTNLEFRLTYTLMTRVNHTFGSQELIQHVWGFAADGDYVTLKNLVYRLRRKIEPNPIRPRLLKTVGNSGYKLVSE